MLRAAVQDKTTQVFFQKSGRFFKITQRFLEFDIGLPQIEQLRSFCSASGKIQIHLFVHPLPIDLSFFQAAKHQTERRPAAGMVGLGQQKAVGAGFCRSLPVNRLCLLQQRLYPVCLTAKQRTTGALAAGLHPLPPVIAAPRPALTKVVKTPFVPYLRRIKTERVVIHRADAQR